jgi:hypothetical protein
MIVSGWQASKVFDTGNTINTVNGGNTVNTVNAGNNDTGISKKSSGGGCDYNPNAEGRADLLPIVMTDILVVAKINPSASKTMVK